MADGVVIGAGRGVGFGKLYTQMGVGWLASGKLEHVLVQWMVMTGLLSMNSMMIMPKR